MRIAEPSQRGHFTRADTGVETLADRGRRALLATGAASGLLLLGGCGAGRVRRPRVTGRVERGTVATGSPVVYRVGAEPGEALVVRVLSGAGAVRFTVIDPAGEVLFDTADAPGPAAGYTGSVRRPGEHAVVLSAAGSTPARYAVEIGRS